MAENFFGITDTGKLRNNNEDAFIAMEAGNRYIIACVIDGVGGYEGGEVAAAIAKDSITELLSRPFSDAATALKDALYLTNQRIFEEKERNSQNASMACVLTLALVDISNNILHYIHVGDTRMYLLREQSLVKLTKDHSFVGFLEDNGRLSEDEAMRHPKRNEINKALGFDQYIHLQADYFETGTSPFLSGDMLLLCSDGLTDLVKSSEIISMLTANTSLADKCETLVRAANHEGGKDNITAVLVYNNRPRQQHESARPMLSEKKTETIKHTKDSNATPSGGSNIPVIVLALVCAGLATALVWQIRKKGPKDTEPDILVNVPQKQRNQKEVAFANTLIADTNYVRLDSITYKGDIVISDTLTINRDTLHINGGGTVLRSDTSYTGPGLVLQQHSKRVILENIAFENFSVGIVAMNNRLELRNVSFRNCGVPVQHNFSFTDGQYRSGIIDDSLTAKPDSLPQNQTTVR